MKITKQKTTYTIENPEGEKVYVKIYNDGSISVLPYLGNRNTFIFKNSDPARVKRIAKLLCEASALSESKTKTKTKKNTLKELLEKGNFDYVNSNITQDNFPDTGERGKVEIVHFDEDLSTKEVLKKLDKKGLRPANIYELLEYAQKSWNGEDWVIALGSECVDPGGDRSVPYLRGVSGIRIVSLFWLGCRWGSSDRFAACAM